MDAIPPVISLLLPSRGRPAALVAMMRSAVETADHPDELQVSAVIDPDDPTRREYLALQHEWQPIMTVTVGPDRGVMSDLWNRCLPAATGEILGFAADDLRYRTAGWDTKIKAAFAAVPDRIAMVYGRDGVADRATHPFIHRAWVDAVGRFTPPYFVGDYADFWLWRVALRLGRAVFLPDVETEHLHPTVGKGPEDENYRERVARMQARPTPAEVWEATRSERDAEAVLLRARMRP